jgi:hypothetical protein
MANTIEVNTVDEAKQVAAGRTGPFLVLSQETLDQIRAAEAAGGFEGGMSGASGEGGFSAPGSGGPDSSSASDPVPTELLDMDGAVPVGAFFEGAAEKILDIRDVWEAIHGHALGPIILVPKRELDRFLGNTSTDA